jgi:5-methylcytosine-specific restriction endonuclease McrA
MKKTALKAGTKSINSAGLTNNVRREVYRRDGYMCALCGDPRTLQIHHYVARAQGGCNHPMNLITLCPYCHNVIHHNMEPAADYMDAEELKQACAEYLGDLYADKGEVWYPYEG